MEYCTYKKRFKKLARKPKKIGVLTRTNELGFDALLEHWVDVYRYLYPLEEEKAYTWWSNRGQAYANNTGWRLDYQLTTPKQAKRVKRAVVYKQQRFSDHAPLVIDYV